MPEPMSLLIIIGGLMFLGLFLRDSIFSYSCPGCGARREDGHSKDCHFGPRE